tara:strand:+ start:4310 stop:5287 length:978 start_codon:yes stop_codon:yes gene_type:complete
MNKLVLLLAIITAVVIVACSGDSQESNDVVVTLDWFQNANHVGVYEAVSKGYFGEENLNVTIQPPADPAAILGLVANGESDFAFYYQPDLLQARQEGVPVVAVAGIVQRPLNSIMTLKSSGIETPGQLAGKKVGTPGLPWNDAMLETMLEADGASIDDVEIVDLGWNVSPGLMAGEVDAIIGVYWTYESIIMGNQGFETNVIYPHEWQVPNYYELVLVTSENNVRDNPDLVERFVNAFNKGYEQAAKDPQGSVDTMLALNPDAEIDEPTDREGVELLAPLWKSEGAPVGSFDGQRWESLVTWMKSQKLLDESFVADDAYDSSFSK